VRLLGSRYQITIDPPAPTTVTDVSLIGPAGAPGPVTIIEKPVIAWQEPVEVPGPVVEVPVIERVEVPVPYQVPVIEKVEIPQPYQVPVIEYVDKPVPIPGEKEIVYVEKPVVVTVPGPPELVYVTPPEIDSSEFAARLDEILTEFRAAHYPVDWAEHGRTINFGNDPLKFNTVYQPEINLTTFRFKWRFSALDTATIYQPLGLTLLNGTSGIVLPDGTTKLATSTAATGSASFTYTPTQVGDYEFMTFQYQLDNPNVFNESTSSRGGLIWVEDPSVGGVTTLANLCYNATLFNQDISDWDTSQITNMSAMFYGATAMLTALRTRQIVIDEWDVANVTNMNAMFRGLTTTAAINGGMDLTHWCVKQIPTTPTSFATTTTSGSTDATTAFPTNRRPVWGTCPLERTGDARTWCATHSLPGQDGRPTKP